MHRDSKKVKLRFKFVDVSAQNTMDKIMVDRTARERLSELIHSYLNDEITAFAFDDELDAFRDSDDSTVQYVANQLWYFYDDCDDHLAVLSKPAWNYHQRLLLLLESDFSVSVTDTRQWSYLQPVAALLLCLCAIVATATGYGEHLLIFFIPFGIGSIAISHIHRCAEQAQLRPYEDILTPFNTFHELQSAYLNTQFKKVRFPEHLVSRSIRSPSMHRLILLQTYLQWAMFAPLPLLFQCFPPSKSTVQLTPATHL